MRATFEKVPGRPDVSWHFYVRRAARFPFEWHYHDEAELTLILSGSGQRYVGDSVGRYETGDFVLVGANVPHSWRSEAENGQQMAATCQFRPDFLGDGLFSAPEFADISQLLDAAAAGISFGTDAAPESFRVQRMQDLPGPERTLELLGVLQCLAGRWQQPLSVSPRLNLRDATSRRRIEAVIAYIDQAYPDVVTLGDAASVVAMTSSSLSRYFRAHTGRRFSDYLNDIRCAAASRRLVDTDESVASVAGACGFPNIANFNRRFRERFGMSPRAYRLAHQAQTPRDHRIGASP